MGQAAGLAQVAREAMSRRAWQESLEAFRAADGQSTLSAEDLEAMSEVAFWAGDSMTALEARQRAYGAYVDEDRVADAAAAALIVCTLSFMRGDMALASGWLGRAQRLLVDLPECVAHAHMAWLEGQFMILAKGYDQALEQAQQVASIAQRINSRDFGALGLAMQGFVRRRSGDTARGMGLIDEALASALAGELGPFATAEVFCEMLLSCIEIADYERAAQWLGAAERAGQDLVCFPGCCRTHRATLLRHQGQWEQAHEEAKQAVSELADLEIMHWGMALYEMGELHRSRGELAVAERAFEEAYEKGWSPQPGLALLLLEKGDKAGASQMIEAAIDRSIQEPEQLVTLLPAQVEIAIAAGDLALADAAATRLSDLAESLGSTAALAASTCATGFALHQHGDLTAARQRMESGVDLWQRAHSPYEAARARMHLASVLEELGDHASARLALSTARKTFDRLGALPEARQATRLLDEDSPHRAERTFMFTDIVNSTTLLSAIGDDAWAKIQQWHDRTLRRLVMEHGGQVVKTTGDGFFVAFDDPQAALDCAVSIQRTLDEHRRTQGYSPSVRIGMHAGAALDVEGDYAGKDVVIAARVGSIASADEILVTVDLVERARPALPVSRSWFVTLKGIPDELEVIVLDWH